MSSSKTVLLLAFLTTTVCAPIFAQENPFRVVTQALPKKATVGQEIRLLVDIQSDVRITTILNQLNFNPFEIKDIQLEPWIDKDGNKHQKLTAILTIFEIGKAAIPPVRLSYQDSRGNIGQIVSESEAVEIVSVGKRKSDKEDIRPIKGPAFLKGILFRTILLGTLLLILLIVLITIIIIRKRKKIFDPESLKPADERAKLELGRLKEKGFLQNRNYKEFYSEFSDILRRYLERRYSFQALELTTAELVTLIKEKNFDSALTKEIRELLENSDLVKFAKFDPPHTLADALETQLLHILEATKPVPVEEPAKKGMKK